MVSVKVTTSGQLSLPAAIRRRWSTARVVVIDEGDRVVIRPLPDDPISAAMGSLAGPGPTSEQMRRAARQADGEAEERRARR